MKSSYLETIKIVDGKVQNIQYHQQRYESVLADYNSSSSLSLVELIKAPLEGLYRCRFVYKPHDITQNEISYHPYVKRTVKKLKLLINNDIKYDKKSTNRDMLNKLFASREECDDILIVKNDLITDTSIANIAFHDGTKWITPKYPLLKGTTRQRLLDKGEIFEENIKVKDLTRFRQVALLNAMIDFDIIPNISFKK